MIRLLTAAAVAVLLATPVMAQSVSPSERSDPSMQNQGTSSSPGSSSSGSMSTSPGLSNQAPADCLPNDPRPACQTAQLPGQDPAGSSSGTTGSQIERQESMPPSGSGSSGSGSSGSSGSMGR
ncbi:MAG: hypothetical protein ACM31D_04900 [Bacteroidota bacterium]